VREYPENEERRKLEDYRMIRSRIIGTGSYLPEKILTNHDLEKLTDTNDEWIRQRTGIEQRHIVAEGEGTSDLGARAAVRAIASAGVKPSDIDLVVCSTMTPDYVFPSASCLIQHKIGARHAAAVDVQAACTGFIYGLSVVDAFIRSGVYKTILLVGADIMSNRLIWENRDTAVLFGDGAGAVVVRGEKSSHGVLSTFLAADGGHLEMFYVPAGGSKNILRPETIAHTDLSIVMKGRELFKKAVASFMEAAQKALDATGMSIEDVDLIVPHQANTRIIYSFSDKLGVPREKVFVNIQKLGNTVAATIPIALDDAVQAGTLQQGKIALLLAFGAGLTWGSAMVRW